MPSPQLRNLTLLPCWRWVGTPLYPETCELRGDGPPCEYLYGPPSWIPAMTELGGGEPPPLPIDRSLGLGFCLCFSSSLSRSDPRFWDPPIPFQHWHALTAHLQEIRRIGYILSLTSVGHPPISAVQPWPLLLPLLASSPPPPPPAPCLPPKGKQNEPMAVDHCCVDGASHGQFYDYICKTWDLTKYSQMGQIRSNGSLKCFA